MSRPVEEPQQSTSDADDGPRQPASVPVFVETAAAALSSDETRSENPKVIDAHDDFLKDDVPTLVCPRTRLPRPSVRRARALSASDWSICLICSI